MSFVQCVCCVLINEWREKQCSQKVINLNKLSTELFSIAVVVILLGICPWNSLSLATKSSPSLMCIVVVIIIVIIINIIIIMTISMVVLVFLCRRVLLDGGG